MINIFSLCCSWCGTFSDIKGNAIKRIWFFHLCCWNIVLLYSQAWRRTKFRGFISAVKMKARLSSCDKVLNLLYYNSSCIFHWILYSFDFPLIANTWTRYRARQLPHFNMIITCIFPPAHHRIKARRFLNTSYSHKLLSLILFIPLIIMHTLRIK